MFGLKIGKFNDFTPKGLWLIAGYIGLEIILSIALLLAYIVGTLGIILFSPIPYINLVFIVTFYYALKKFVNFEMSGWKIVVGIFSFHALIGLYYTIAAVSVWEPLLLFVFLAEMTLSALTILYLRSKKFQFIVKKEVQSQNEDRNFWENIKITPQTIGYSLVVSIILAIFGPFFLTPNFISMIMLNFFRNLWAYYTLATIFWMGVFWIVYALLQSKGTIMKLATIGVVMTVFAPTILVFLFAPDALEVTLAVTNRFYSPNYNIPLFTWPADAQIGEPAIMWEPRGQEEFFARGNSTKLKLEYVGGVSTTESDFKSVLLPIIKNREVKEWVDSNLKFIRDEKEHYPLYLNETGVVGTYEVNLEARFYCSERESSQLPTYLEPCLRPGGIYESTILLTRRKVNEEK